jgi:serine protease Do
MNSDFNNQDNFENQNSKDNLDTTGNDNIGSNDAAGNVNNSAAPDYNAGNVNNSAAPDYNAGNVNNSAAPDYNAGNVNNSATPDYNAGNVNNSGAYGYNAGSAGGSNSYGYGSDSNGYNGYNYNAGNNNGSTGYGYNPNSNNYSAYNAGSPNDSNNADNSHNWNGQDNNQYSQYGGNPQYKWNYDDYQKALNQNSKPVKKKSGLKPLIITVCSIFGVGIIGLTIVGIMSLAGVGSMGNILRSSTSTTTDTPKNPNGPSLNIASQPQTSTTAAPAGTEMNATQIAAKLTPEVVGIVDYNLQSVEPTAEGTGIIMSSNGYIITNEHVIDGAQKISIVLSSGKTYNNVQTVGVDVQTDLAVLKINATGLPCASFGDSSQLKVGQSVIAIGNPGGLELASTVTNGIVSGLNRSISETVSSMTYIQTNALINPGNSGGPLVNMYGQVVGINCSKIESSNGETFEGIGFAIPINSAKPIIDSIIKNGYVTGRVKVGISIYPLSNSQAQMYNYPAGLYVEDIDQTSDAYAKGLRDKDIITKIDGISIAADDAETVYNTFYNEETKHKVGDTITLTVYKTDTGNTSTISVKLAEDKGDDSTSTSASVDGSSGDSQQQQQQIPGNQGGTDGSGSTDGTGSTDNSQFWSGFGQ